MKNEEAVAHLSPATIALLIDFAGLSVFLGEVGRSP